eukprot:COSAG05_NODE_534_length_8874_cov_19.159544_9_plen_173_part_00
MYQPCAAAASAPRGANRTTTGTARAVEVAAPKEKPYSPPLKLMPGSTLASALAALMITCAGIDPAYALPTPVNDIATSKSNTAPLSSSPITAITTDVNLGANVSSGSNDCSWVGTYELSNEKMCHATSSYSSDSVRFAITVASLNDDNILFRAGFVSSSSSCSWSNTNFDYW